MSNKLQTYMGIAIFLASMLTGLATAVAQSNEESALVAKIKEAESAVLVAREELATELKQGKPLLSRLAAGKQKRVQASRDLKSILDEHADALNELEKAKDELSRRRGLWQHERPPHESEPKSEKTAHAKRLEKILSDIAASEARLELAKSERNRLGEELKNENSTSVILTYLDLFQDAQAITDRIRAAEMRLATAQDALEQVRNEARWKLRDNAPPFLYRVRTLPAKEAIGQKASIAYHVEWVGGAEESEELLRLAQYLHRDLGRTIDLRYKRVLEWFDIVEKDRILAQERLDTYISLVGGSSDGKLGYLERALDKISFGMLGGVVTGGSMTWDKIGVELLDSFAAAGRTSATSRVPAHISLSIEAIRQVSNSLAYTRNPEWDVNRLPSVNDAALATGPEIEMSEREVFESVTADSILASLKRMKSVSGEQLSSRAFQKRLLEQYGGHTLAAAFTDATYRRAKPDTRKLAEVMQNASYSDAITRAFLSSTGDTRRLALESAKVLFPQHMRAAAVPLGGGQAQFLATLQATMKEKALSELEVKRISAWNAYVDADIQARFTMALMVNEGRLRRLDVKIRKLLADEVIRDLTSEVGKKADTRKPEIVSRKNIGGKTATVALAFSRPVVLRQVLANGKPVTFTGSGSLWFATLPVAELAKPTKSVLTTVVKLSVDAAHPAIDDRTLDDPVTVAKWSAVSQQFTGYEPGPDIHHELQLAADLGPVRISVRKLIQQGDVIDVNFSGSMFFDHTAWIGIVPASVPRNSESASEKSAVWRKQIGRTFGEHLTVDRKLAGGFYQVRIFDDDNNGNEVAIFDFEVCSKGDDSIRCN